MALTLDVLGVGLIFTGQATTIPIVLMSTIVMSFGFHFFEPCSSGVVLMSVEREESPKVLGQLRSLGAIAALVATGVVYLLVDRLGYRALFLIVGAVVAVGGVILFTRGKGEHGLPPKRRGSGALAACAPTMVNEIRQSTQAVIWPPSSASLALAAVRRPTPATGHDRR